MLQSSVTLNHQSLPRCLKQLPSYPNHERKEEEAAVLSARDLSELYPQAVLRSSDAIGWQNVRAIHFRHCSRELVIPASGHHCLVLNLGAPFFTCVNPGKRSSGGEIRSGEVAIIPAGSPWVCRAEGGRLQTMLLLYLRPLFVRSAVNEFNFSFNEIDLTPQIGFKNKHICHVAMSLLEELNEGNVVGRLYADSLATGLAIQIIRRYTSFKDIQIGHGGMAPHKLRKALGLIDHHLANEEEGRVALRTVARHVGMSYFHFSRAFKHSMGMTPTNYIAERRIERAKRLLEETELPISEIALRSGFSSQSHFTTAFRRFAGATPKVFRATL